MMLSRVTHITGESIIWTRNHSSRVTNYDSHCCGESIINRLEMVLSRVTNYGAHYCGESISNRLEMILSRVTRYDSHYCGEGISNN